MPLRKLRTASGSASENLKYGISSRSVWAFGPATTQGRNTQVLVRSVFIITWPRTASTSAFCAE